MTTTPPPSFTASGFLYNPQTQSLLLHLRDGNTTISPHKWAFFGGTSEGPETPLQCFLREIKEELTIDLSPQSVRPLRDYLNPATNKHRYIFYAESQLPKSAFTLTEGADFDWILLSNLNQYDLTKNTAQDLQFFIKNFL